MNEVKGRIPIFEPISEAFKKPDHWLYQKEEQLALLRPLKELTHIPPRPILPKFKAPTKTTLSHDDRKEVRTSTASRTGTSEQENYEEIDYESDGEYESEYEDSEGVEDSEWETVTMPDTTSTSLAPPGPEEPPPNFGSPPTLLEICLRTLARHFSTMWKYVNYLPENTMKDFSSYIDLNTVDVGLAALVIHDKWFWRRMTRTRWAGYHRPWAHGGNWKIYFLQKYLAEVIANSNPDVPKTRSLLRLVRRIKKWVYSLDIKQLSVAPWPTAVGVDSSTDTAVDTEDEHGVKSDMSLTEYLNRHVNFFPHPSTTVITRLPLKPIFECLPYLTHLTLSFGFDNYHLQRDYKFARISDEDASNLSQALAVCSSLYCFKLTRSIISPKHLETVTFGISKLEFLREVELSHLFLTDEHMVAVAGLLLMKSNMKLLSLKNNNIGSEGFIRLLHVIVLKDCELRILDVSTNPAIGDSGGVAMAALLAKKRRYLKRVIMAGTGLTDVSGYNFGVVLYYNKTLEVLDLSANTFNEFAAESLLKGLEHNYTLKRLDVRECGIPFTTVREMERITFNNTENARKQNYEFPKVHPRDFWSGFKELDSDLTEVIKPARTEEELAEEEESVTRELLKIFVWATAPMKPRHRMVLVRDIHAFMKKTNFVTGFDAVIDKLILNKQKEIIARHRVDSKREKDERLDSSMVMDYSFAEVHRRSNEKTKIDFVELEAMEVLKDVNRCGRLDELFKSVRSERIDDILNLIGKTLDNDTELLSSAGMRLPFAQKWYKRFPFIESQDECNVVDEIEGEEQEEEELGEEVDGENEQSNTADEHYTSIAGEPSETLPKMKELAHKNPNVGANARVTSGSLPSRQLSAGKYRSASLMMEPSKRSRSLAPGSSVLPIRDGEGIQATRDKCLGIRTDFRKWPKDGPPKFPKVVPYEIVEDCREDLPDTEPENEDDFPYWLDQWIQKY